MKMVSVKPGDLKEKDDIIQCMTQAYSDNDGKYDDGDSDSDNYYYNDNDNANENDNDNYNDNDDDNNIYL